MATSSSSKHIPLVSNFSGFFAKFSAKVSIFLSILRVKKAVATKTKASKQFFYSDGSRPLLERIREAKRQGIPLKFTQGDNPTLKKYLDATPKDSCRDEEWHNIREVGREIVD